MAITKNAPSNVFHGLSTIQETIDQTYLTERRALEKARDAKISATAATARADVLGQIPQRMSRTPLRKTDTSISKD